MKTFTISKSSFLMGLQCRRALWHKLRQPDSFPKPDKAQQALFDAGHEVGDWAKKRFPGGIEIPWDGGTDKAVEETRILLKERKPIFETTFRIQSPHGPVMMRADVLLPVNEDEWDLIEVKGTTEVKDVHISDVAFQKYVLVGSGIKVRRTYLMHLNNTYSRKGEIDPQELFTLAPVDSMISEFMPQVEGALEGMFAVLTQESPPTLPIGRYCNEPYACALSDQCWSYLPEKNVFGLYWGGKKAWTWFENGIYNRADIPIDADLNAKQRIQLEAERSGAVHAEIANLREILDRLEYPLYYMDFETFSTPVPLFDDSRPYQQIPFQYSVHVQERPGGPLAHHAFLADIECGTVDPRSAFIRELREVLGQRGSIVVYNQSFEKGRLGECVQVFPELRKWYEDYICPRMVDLLHPFRSFHYYHPDQNGSASIKAVLPAITGKGYEGMEIADGGTASLEYLRTHLSSVPEEEKAKVRQALSVYCKLDTEGMVWIIDKLYGLAV